jgi:hypothetical protein
LKRSTRAFLFTGLSGTGKTIAAEVIARISGHTLTYFRGAPRFEATGAIHTRLFWRFGAGFSALHQWKAILKNENLYCFRAYLFANSNGHL